MGEVEEAGGVVEEAWRLQWRWGGLGLYQNKAI